MTKILMIPAVALAFAAAVPAVASESEPQCPASAAAEHVSADTIRAELEAVGYRIDEIEVEDGCYEVEVMNESGYPVEAVYEQATGRLVRAELD